MAGQWVPWLTGLGTTGAGSLAAWVLGGRKQAAAQAQKANAEASVSTAEATVKSADAATAAVGAASEAVELVRSIVRNEVESLTERVAAAEARATRAERHASLLTGALIAQRQASSELTAWADRATVICRAHGIDLDPPPEIPELLIPTEVQGG